MLVLGEYEQYMFEFWLRFDAFDIFWFEVLNFFLAHFRIVILCQTITHFWPFMGLLFELGSPSSVEFESKCLLCVL